MEKVSPGRKAFPYFAAVAQAFANTHRLTLLQLLAQAERSVEEVAALAGISLANASQHLQHLRRAGVVTSRREGKRIFYRLSGDAVIDALGALQTIALRNFAEVREIVAQTFAAPRDLEPVSGQQLSRWMKIGAVTVIDVRPPEEFAYGHIKGAVNVPLEQIAQGRLALPHSKEIIAYCRGPYCVMAHRAVAELRRRGFKARRLKEGYPQWKAAGLAIEEQGIARPRATVRPGNGGRFTTQSWARNFVPGGHI